MSGHLKEICHIYKSTDWDYYNPRKRYRNLIENSATDNAENEQNVAIRSPLRYNCASILNICDVTALL